jgi:hypothetical protein
MANKLGGTVGEKGEDYLLKQLFEKESESRAGSLTVVRKRA